MAKNNLHCPPNLKLSKRQPLPNSTTKKTLELWKHLPLIEPPAPTQTNLTIRGPGTSYSRFIEKEPTTPQPWPRELTSPSSLLYLVKPAGSFVLDWFYRMKERMEEDSANGISPAPSLRYSMLASGTSCVIYEIPAMFLLKEALTRIEVNFHNLKENHNLKTLADNGLIVNPNPFLVLAINLLDSPLLESPRFGERGEVIISGTVSLDSIFILNTRRKLVEKIIELERGVNSTPNVDSLSASDHLQRFDQLIAMDLGKFV